MTVTELIAALETVEDKSLPVECEGCDCANPAKGVRTDTERQFVPGGTIFPARVLIEADLA